MPRPVRRDPVPEPSNRRKRWQFLSKHIVNTTLRTTAILAAVSAVATSLSQVTKDWSINIPKLTEAYADAGFLALGHGDRKWTIYDVRTGKATLRFSECNGVRLQGHLALVALGSNTEIWNLRSRKREHAVPVFGVALGAVIDKSFFFMKDSHVVRWDLAAGKEVDRRPAQTSFNKWPLRTNGKRIFIDPVEHEILGLDPNDLSKGWRSYCDSYIGSVHDDYVLLFSKLFFSLRFLDMDGKVHTAPAMDRGYMQATRQPPARIGNTVAQGGMWVGDNGNTLVSPYFFAAELPSGRLLWKRPMVGTSPVSVSGKFAVIESHGDWGIYSGRIGTIPSQVVLIDPATGKTVGKIGPLFTPDYDKQPRLLATDGMLCFIRGEAVTAYRVR